MPDRKARYSVFCRNHYAPLHFQPWWLDAVCGPEGWQVALATGKSGEIQGVLPYCAFRRWGLKTIQLPPLTTYGGPWLVYPQNAGFKAISRFSFEKKVMGELITQLPRTVLFKQNFRPEITNWLPFYWKKFRQTTRYTYLIEETAHLEKIMAGFKNTLRSDLKKAEAATETQLDPDVWPTVFELNRRSFRRKSQSQPYQLEIFNKLHNALRQRNQSACLVAFDRATGRPSAGLYLAFDSRQAAVLLTGTEPALKSQCAVYRLFWEAICFCSERGLSLDLEGSMDERIEHAFRSFGGRLVPYFQVWKSWV